jgi:hypothetical protein
LSTLFERLRLSWSVHLSEQIGVALQGGGGVGVVRGNCASYLAYPFQQQEVNSHEEDSITPNLMRECKEKELVKPS